MLTDLLYIATCLFSLAAAQLSPTGPRIIVTNDDGWATANIRALFFSLVEENYNVVLSAPALDASGTGSLDLPPVPVILGCEFESCPPGSPPTGQDNQSSRMNYVNSFPATSAKFGIQQFGPTFFDGQMPDLVVAGPNVGNNLGIVALLSGTVGAASAASQLGVPGLAISGAFSTAMSFEQLSTSSQATTAAEVYASLTADLIAALLKPGHSIPILPSSIILNVNYPEATGSCQSADSFKFVLTRSVSIPVLQILAPSDVTTCGRSRLPTESDLILENGCFATVSVLDAVTGLDVDKDTQAAVLNRLDGFLSCP